MTQCKLCTRAAAVEMAVNKERSLMGRWGRRSIYRHHCRTIGLLIDTGFRKCWWISWISIFRLTCSVWPALQPVCRKDDRLDDGSAQTTHWATEQRWGGYILVSGI